jgi:hypothetical protein
MGRAMKHECKQMKEYGYPVQEIYLDHPNEQSWEMELGETHDPMCTLFISYCPFCGEELNNTSQTKKEHVKPVMPTVPQIAHDLDASLHMIGVEMTKVNPVQEIINKLLTKSKNWAIALSGSLNKFQGGH